jgi:hypothetical protein
MVEFDYTPRVAQETAGLGFTLPLPQRQQGVDVRNANPQTRATQAASMPFYEQADDITSALTTLRDAYIADVQDLNTLVQEGVELGYDARTIDYQDPQSIEVNKRYREVLNRVKSKELELRNAKPVVDAVAKSRGVFNPEAMSYGEIDPFFGAAEAAAAFNQGVGTQGYGEEGMTEALKAKAQAEQNINAIYAPQFEKYKNNPAMMQSLEDKRLRDISSLQAISKKEAPREPMERNPLSLKVAEWELKNEFDKISKTQEYMNGMQAVPIGSNLVALSPDGSTRNIGQPYRVALINEAKPTTTTALTSEGKKSGLKDIRYDGLQIVGYGKDGKIITDDKVPVSQYAGFKVMAKGIAEEKAIVPPTERPQAGKVAKPTYVEKAIDVFDDPSVVATSGDAEYKLVLAEITRQMQVQAENMTKALKGGESVPSAQPAATTQQATPKFKGQPSGGFN